MVVVIVLLGTRAKNQKRSDQKKEEKEKEKKEEERKEREKEREKKIGRNNEDTDLHPIRLCPFFRWRN